MSDFSRRAKHPQSCAAWTGRSVLSWRCAHPRAASASSALRSATGRQTWSRTC